MMSQGDGAVCRLGFCIMLTELSAMTMANADELWFAILNDISLNAEFIPCSQMLHWIMWKNVI